MGVRRKIAKAARAATVAEYRGPLIKYRVAPSFEHHRLLASHQHDAIVDVGANRGQFSLLARHLNPKARIYAYEPHPGAASIFRRVLPDVDLREVAVTDHTGVADLHIHTSSDGSSTLPFTGSIRTVTVPAVMLDEEFADDLPGGNALLKIDVQGAEGEVLAGARKVLTRFSHVLVELSLQPAYHGLQPHGRQMIELLGVHGFDLVALDTPVIRNGLIVGFDGFFERS